MTPYLQDADVTLYHGDALVVLSELPAESVDCCVTSPPYWGLRDYGTPGQLGLEPTPEQYVERMVEVFREVRRVLAAHGTVWLNLGDSYASSPPGNVAGVGATNGLHGANDASGTYRETLKAGHATKRNTVVGDLKQKDLCGIPWMVAFALRADGWYLRSDIIWAKPNPMPESVTDRPTKAHEYVFLLSKQPRYFFDQEAVREAAQWERWGDQTNEKYYAPDGWARNGEKTAIAHSQRPRSTASWIPEQSKEALQERAARGRNIRSVWEIATQPYPEAHFATFPEELARRCIAAGCPEQVCRVCGKARERVVLREQPPEPEHRQPEKRLEPGQAGNVGAGNMGFRASRLSGQEMNRWHAENPGVETWANCGHSDYRPGVTLDPFVGSGTTCHVARKLGRRSIGIDLSADYLDLAARRLQQQSLFALDNGAERSPSAERTQAGAEDPVQPPSRAEASA